MDRFTKAIQAYIQMRKEIEQAINTYQQTLIELGYVEIKGKVTYGEPGHWEAYIHPDYLKVAEANLLFDYGGGFWMPDKAAMEEDLQYPLPDGTLLPLITIIPDGFELSCRR